MSEKTNEISIANLKAKVSEFLYMEDDGVIDAIIACVIANKLNLDAVWLMVVSGSSSGKTELINPLFGLPFIIPISDLTVNTFASGFHAGGGKQASLLQRYQNGILVFKDFTSILSKGRDARDAILAQMREIYEGRFDKQTGTGEEISWKGKMGAIAASTGAIYIEMANSTQMGQRFIYYNMKQPDRKKASEKADEMTVRGVELREDLKQEYSRYINHVIDYINENEINYDVPDDVRKDIRDLANFSTIARSPVHTDFKSGSIDDKPDLEGPGRVVKQLIALSGAFIAMNKADQGMRGADRLKDNLLTETQEKVLSRCAYDSIPSMRRNVLRLLARYEGGVNTAAAAAEMNMPSDSVKKYLYQINALGLCERKIKTGNKGHMWVMTNSEYRRIVCRMERITSIEKELVKDTDDDEQETTSLDPSFEESERAASEAFDSFGPENF